MRENKYRAWDDYQQMMLSWADLGEADKRSNLSLWNTLNGLVEHITPLEFTGLKDKNGKDWYDGDIVKAPSGVLFETFWSDDDMGWKLSNGGGDWKSTFNINAPLYEIVGNIFQSPELVNTLNQTEE